MRTGDFPDSNNCPDCVVAGTGKAKMFYHRETWPGGTVGVERVARGPDRSAELEESSPPLPSPIGKTVWCAGPGTTAFRNTAPPTFWPVRQSLGEYLQAQPCFSTFDPTSCNTCKRNPNSSYHSKFTPTRISRFLTWEECSGVTRIFSAPKVDRASKRNP